VLTLKDAPYARLRQLYEFSEMVSVAASNGYFVVEGAEHYRNQQSRFHLCCKDGMALPGCKGKCLDPSSKAAGKIKAGQGCKYRGRERSRVKRQKPWAEVVKVIENHPANLQLVPGVADYKNEKTLLHVACIASGHEFLQSYEQLRRRDTKMSSCPHCGRGWAEALALSVAEDFLGIRFQTEVSPEFVKAWNDARGSLRFDGFAQAMIARKMLEIALEHQGEQHTNPLHFFHTNSPDPAASFARLEEADNYKKAVCVGDRRLILVQDLTQVGSLDKAVAAVADAIKKAIPECDAQGLDERAADLVTDHYAKLMSRLRAFSPMHSVLTRIQTQAQDLGLELVAYDPITRRIQTTCEKPEHGVSAWRPLYPGVTGCKLCYYETISERDRLPEGEVIAAALNKMWVPLWPPGKYKNQCEKMNWMCVRCCRTVEDSFVHVKVRSCTKCNTREKLFGKVINVIETRGDKLLTEKYKFPVGKRGKIELLCTRPGGCNQPFPQRIEKLLKGQLHMCDKGKRAAKTRYRGRD